jgi:hypothetical protein
MPVVRKLVAQASPYHQWLKVDHPQRYILNKNKFWQPLFGPNSELNNSNQVAKIAAELDTDTLNNIKLSAYLYDPRNGSIANAATCTFKVFKISAPNWTETLITTLSGSQLVNSYFYSNPTISSLVGTNLDGNTTLMIEATILRSGVTYRDRIYVNHLGVYNSILRLRNDVQFLDLTKQDE